MRLASFNVWPAFSDMMFVLFVSTLVGAAAFDQERRTAVEEAQQLRGELERLKKENVNCGGADPFFRAFTSCLAEHGGALAKDVREDHCQIVVSERLVKFSSNRDTVTSQTHDNAVVLARCLGDALVAFSHEPGFDAIDTIHVDGHTDCEAGAGDNLVLGAQRARTFVMMIDRHLSSVAPSQHRALMERVGVRSFGEFRPTAGSLCRTEDDVAASDDRRVTVTVAQRLQGGT